jgi:HK97 family phage prohead protease
MPAAPSARPTGLETSERRFVRVTELRVVGEGQKRTIEGTAAVYNQETMIGRAPWGFREVVRPGAFTTALKSDVRCLFNHDPNVVLGRTKSGTMELRDTGTGLKFVCTPPDSQAARDVMASIDRGDVDGCSFGFRTLKDRWTFANKDGETDLRELLEAELFDVGPVTYPAYEQTDVGVRSIDASREEARRVAGAGSNETARLRLDLEELT